MTLFLVILLGIIFLLGQIVFEEYARFQEGIYRDQRIAENIYLSNIIEKQEEQLAQVRTVAYRIQKKKKDLGYILPSEQVYIVSELPDGSYSGQYDVDVTIANAYNEDQKDILFGISIPERWNSLLFGYRIK